MDYIAKNNCSHIQIESLKDTGLIKTIHPKYNQCKECSEKENVMLCLTCMKCFCEKEHCKLHIKTHPSHSIFINITNRTGWCNICGVITSDSLNQYINAIPSSLTFDNFILPSNEELMALDKTELNRIKYMNLVNKLKTKKLKNVMFLVGPEINASAGVPDFRKCYDLLMELMAGYGLNSPEECFSLDVFIEQPQLFYDFCKKIDLDQYEPTLAHLFMRYLIEAKIGKYVFTENIDGLELKAGIPRENVVFAFGNSLEAHCALCDKSVPVTELKYCIKNNTIKRCSECQGPCKPKVVLFGEIPHDLFNKKDLLAECDFCFIIGTELEVAPFSTLPSLIKENCPYCVISSQEMDLFSPEEVNPPSLFLKGSVNSILTQLLTDCGWWDDINLRYLKDD